MSIHFGLLDQYFDPKQVNNNWGLQPLTGIRRGLVQSSRCGAVAFVLKIKLSGNKYVAPTMNDSFHFVHTTHAEFNAGMASCLAATKVLKPGVCTEKSLVATELQFVIFSLREWKCVGWSVVG